MGYLGSERTTRRAVAEAKVVYRAGHRRRFRPWLPEPGLWFQWDYGDGPLVNGCKTWLWCAWLAWSRFRVVLPIRDKTLPTVIACIDVTLRRFGGVPTYGLSDNEKTLSVDHIARVAVRNPTMVEVGRYYGLTLASCVPADPQSKGGSEATVLSAAADLVPTDANLLPDYASFVEYRRACDEFCERVNARPHSVTRCPPIERLAQERERLHPLPAEPYTAAFGVTREVGKILPVINFEGGEYSVPDDYVAQTVWVRQQDDEIVIVHVGRDGAHEIARWEPTVPGQPRHDLSSLRTTTGGSAAPHAMCADARRSSVLGHRVGRSTVADQRSSGWHRAHPDQDDRRGGAGEDLRAEAGRSRVGDRSRTGSIC